MGCGVLSGKSTELFMIHICREGGGGSHKYPSTLQAGENCKKGAEVDS